MSAFKLVINGQAVEVLSVEDAAKLLSAMPRTDSPVAAVAKPAVVAPLPPKPANGSSSHEDREDDNLDPATAQMALKFLKAIRDGGATGGIQSEAVMGAFGVTAPKAIGSKSGAVNTLLTDALGMRLKSVYVNPKTPNGRFWKPGKKIDEAIYALEQRLAAVH